MKQDTKTSNEKCDFLYMEKAMGQQGLGPRSLQKVRESPTRFPMPRPQRLKGPYRKNNSFFFHYPKQLVLSSKAPPQSPQSSGNQRFLQKNMHIIFFFQGPMPWGSGPRGPKKLERFLKTWVHLWHNSCIYRIMDSRNS